MKKMIALAAALALALALPGCARGNELLAAASPETSALMLYASADGKSVRHLTMFDAAAEREILAALASVSAKPAKNWTAHDVTAPVYGLTIGRNDGEPGWLECAWSNGCLILADGTAYKFDFDFAALETDYTWRYSEDGLPIGRLPCSHALALGPEGWIAAMLSPAPEPAPPEGISMTLVRRDAGSAEVSFRNDSAAEWCYGLYFRIEVQLDGSWYAVPVQGGYDFPGIAMIVAPGESRQEVYDLTPYGELPAGNYRLVVEDMAVEFAVAAA